MTENYKDSLQKLAQKHKLPSPEYKTIKSGPDHTPEYESYVTINGETFKGEISKTKKLSEARAAFVALGHITNFKYNLNTDKICILIDSDYLQTIDITLKELSNKNLDIYMFRNQNNSMINKTIPNEITIITSPSIEINSVGVCIATYTGSLLTKDLYDIYFIATENKYSLSLIEMIKNSSFGWIPKKAYQITKIEQIYENL